MGSPQIASVGAPTYISNLDGNITVQPYVATDKSYHYRHPDPEMQLKLLKAGELIASGQVAHEDDMCAATISDAMAAAGAQLAHRADACDYPGALEASGFVRVEDGDFQPGDVVGWTSYGNSATGQRFGHVGLVATPGQVANPKAAAASIRARGARSRELLAKTLGGSSTLFEHFLNDGSTAGSRLVPAPEPLPPRQRDPVIHQFLASLIEDFPPSVRDFMQMIYEGGPPDERG